MQNWWFQQVLDSHTQCFCEIIGRNMLLCVALIGVYRFERLSHIENLSVCCEHLPRFGNISEFEVVVVHILCWEHLAFHK